MHVLPIEVKSIIVNDTLHISNDSNSIILNRNKHNKEVEYFNYPFTIPQKTQLTNEKIKNIKVVFSIIGSSNLLHKEVYPWSFEKEILFDRITDSYSESELSKVGF